MVTCINEDEKIDPLPTIIATVMIFLMRWIKPATRLTKLTTLSPLHKWQNTFHKVHSRPHVVAIFFSCPRLSTSPCIHPRRGKEKVFWRQVSNVPETSANKQETFTHVLSWMWRWVRVCRSVHVHVFVCVCACVFWAADSTDWYVFPSVAVGWVWKPICSMRFMVL